MTLTFGGLDLTASTRRRSSACLITDGVAYFLAPLTDDDIVEALRQASVLAIDAPLTGPPLRGHRAVDRLMIRIGFQVLPASWPSMRALAERAIRLTTRLSRAGVRVVETHPRSALRSSGCENPLDLARRLGVRVERRTLNDDEADALVAAIVAMSYVRGEAAAVRDIDGELFLLRPVCRSQR